MLSKYLKDFSLPEPSLLVEDDILGSLAAASAADFEFVEPEPVIDLEAERQEARDAGYAQAVEDLQAGFDEQLAAIQAQHAESLAELTDRHENEVIAVVHSRFQEMTQAITQSLADNTLQVLLPILNAEVARRSVSALADAVHAAFVAEKASEVLVRGPHRLFIALEPRLAADGIACQHIEADTTDITVEVNETILTSRIAAWGVSLSEVME